MTAPTKMRAWRIFGAAVVLAVIGHLTLISAHAQPSESEPLGIAMESYDYPHPVQFISFTINGADIRMGYMDVRPANGGNGRAIVLFHGKNWFSAYWEDTIEVLVQAGYRVVAPDQIGFGKSAKPEIPYSFHQMGRHTKALLDTLGIDEVAAIGHSMGGMAAARFALMYPENASHLIFEDPIGLEDYRTKVPYVPTDGICEDMLRRTREQIRQDLGSYSWNGSRPTISTFRRIIGRRSAASIRGLRKRRR